MKLDLNIRIIQLYPLKNMNSNKMFQPKNRAYINLHMLR